MKNRLLFRAVVMAILASAGAISFAQAADDAFCKDYARTAVSQYRSAARHDRCEVYRRDAGRWQADWRTHTTGAEGLNAARLGPKLTHAKVRLNNARAANK